MATLRQFMPNYRNIDQVLDLAHKTGDKVIIVSEHHDPYVIMSVREYEALLHSSSSVDELSEEQLLEKINRDIAVWKASQSDDSEELSDYNLERFKVDGKGGAKVDKSHDLQHHKANVDDGAVDEEDKYYIEPVD